MPDEPPTASPQTRSFAWAASPAGKAGLILTSLLLMQIPLYMVSGLIDERQSRQDAVEEEFRHSWGPAQTALGPVLAVPYVHPNPYAPDTAERGWIQIPASQLAVSAQLMPEMRRRGLFHAVVYTATLGFSGTLTIPQIDLKDGTQLLWQEAVMAMASSDMRGQPIGSTITIGDNTSKLAIQPVGGSCGSMAGAAAQMTGTPSVGTTIPFRATMVLRGTRSLNVLPYGQQIDMQISGPWRSPSFTGSTLPLTYSIDHAGFHAHWQVAGDIVSGGWNAVSTRQPLCLETLAHDNRVLGVDLLEPVPTYLMVTRTSKYGTLFLALSFLSYFVFEAVSHVRIHLAQYGLLGLSVSLFALLLIALAEPLGFTTGYILSVVAVMAQASLYTLSVVRSRRLAVVFAGMLGLLFGIVYVVLSLDTFALLAGSVAVFVGLSAVMAVTRRLKWDSAGASGSTAQG